MNRQFYDTAFGDIVSLTSPRLQINMYAKLKDVGYFRTVYSGFTTLVVI